MFRIVISEECLGCGECADMCPLDILAMCDGRPVVVSTDSCIGCGICSSTCPAEAVGIIPVKQGVKEYVCTNIH